MPTWCHPNARISVAVQRSRRIRASTDLFHHHPQNLQVRDLWTATQKCARYVRLASGHCGLCVGQKCIRKTSIRSCFVVESCRVSLAQPERRADGCSPRSRENPGAERMERNRENRRCLTHHQDGGGRRWPGFLGYRRPKSLVFSSPWRAK